MHNGSITLSNAFDYYPEWAFRLLIPPTRKNTFGFIRLTLKGLLIFAIETFRQFDAYITHYNIKHGMPTNNGKSQDLITKIGRYMRLSLTSNGSYVTCINGETAQEEQSERNVLPIHKITTMTNQAIKLMATLLLMLLATVAQAQVNHLKFMGIPLDGTIDEFQTKLMEKGFKKSFSDFAPAIGTRVLKGAFSGESVDVFVFYNIKTQIVYGTRVWIYSGYEKVDCNKFENYRASLKNKYKDVGLIPDNKDFECNLLSMNIKQSALSDDTDIIGNVTLETAEPRRYYFYITITYTDTRNGLQNKAVNDRDL